MKKRRNFTPEFKTQVVLELLREEKGLNQLAAEHEIVPSMLRNWKNEFIANASNAFSNKKEPLFKKKRLHIKTRWRTFIKPLISSQCMSTGSKKSEQALGCGWKERTGYKDRF